MAYLLGLSDSTLAYVYGLHDSTRCVCAAGQLEAPGSTSKGSWVSSPKQSFRAEDRRAEGRRASTGSSASLTRSGSVKSKLHSRQPPHVQVHWLCACFRACAHVCVCVCVALYLVNQTLAAQTSGRSNPSQACGACKSNRQMTHAPEQHVRQIATPCVSRYICKSSMDDVLHCVHA